MRFGVGGGKGFNELTRPDVDAELVLFLRCVGVSTVIDLMKVT
jgi:hypothetical protein